MTNVVQNLGRDLQTLGLGGLIRAPYEASKRLGGHRAVFANLAARPTPREVVSTVPTPSAIPAGALERSRREADKVIQGRLWFFGTQLSVGQPPDWHSVLHNEEHWPLTPWWEIDIRSDRRAGDVKWTWELARHRHLVILARAVHADPHEVKWRVALEDQIHSWSRANPLEKGVHWYSNLELSLRALAWLQVLALAGRQLTTDVRRSMAKILYHTGRHLVTELPYTVSSMRNNHLVGDALGLLAIGASFPESRAAHAWSRYARWLFDRQVNVQIKPDGSTVEDSVSYQRFVLEMLGMRACIEPAARSRDQLVAAAQMLSRIGSLEGPVPQYGDWDEGRVLLSAQDPCDLRGSIYAALALAGTGAPPEWRERFDECAWYTPEGKPIPPEPAETQGRDTGAGIARAAVGELVAWLKVGSKPSHGHADLCSTSLLRGKDWIIGDPGTGTYNGPIDQRNYFRCSRAHSVLRVEGLDQLEPHRAFRWKHTAGGQIGEPIKLQRGLLMWGYHDAYRRLSPPRRVARAVLLISGGLVVADWVEGSPAGRYLLSLPLGPDIQWRDNLLTLPDDTRLALDVPADPQFIRGQVEPFDGWWSSTYGAVVPSIRLEMDGMITGPICWAVRRLDTPRPVVAGSTLSVGETTVDVEWGPRTVRLVVDDTDGARTAALDFL
jgi:hypothetical protein